MRIAAILAALSLVFALPLGRSGAQSPMQIDNIIGIMMDFPEENPDIVSTSGDGQFILNSPDAVEDRCDGYHVDAPPHNVAYFERKISALNHYFTTVSNEHVQFDFSVIPQVFTAADSMNSYANSDSLLALLFMEAVEMAKTEIEAIPSDSPNFFDENSLIVLFHAGIGQDFAVPFLDPTPNDLSSAYIEDSMLDGIVLPVLNGIEIRRGILLPESQNHLYYDVIEDIFPGQDSYCDNQVGITGTFALLMGYALGMPPLFDTENGEPGVGVFSLMDHGSNNGNGVMPATPDAWTRIYMGWENAELLEDGTNISQPFRHDESNIFRVNISNNEFFLLEAAGNIVKDGKSIDELRDHDDDDSTADEPFFDTILAEFGPHVILDFATNDIIGFDSYDYGMPGNGWLIWHAQGEVPANLENMNADKNNRFLSLEEADGAIDIGFEKQLMFGDPTYKGWNWDMWYGNNMGWLDSNPGEDDVIFSDGSWPNTRSSDGAKTYFRFGGFQNENSDVATFQFEIVPEFPIVALPEDCKIIGQGDDYFVILVDDEIHKFSADGLEFIESTTAQNPIFLTDGTNEFIVDNPTGNETIIDGELNNDRPLSLGYFNSDSLSEAPEQSAVGDIDSDPTGFDEYLFTDSDQLHAKNGNGSYSDNFPIHGGFWGNVLLADIFGDNKPEIICREYGKISIVSNSGQRAFSIASEYNTELRIVENWAENQMALLDGERLFLLPKLSDNNFWLAPFSDSAQSNSVAGSHSFNLGDSGIDIDRTYIYPNPVSKGNAHFRVFVFDAESIEINIFNAAGKFIETVTEDNLTANDYAEIPWDCNALDSGYYFAELRSGNQKKTVKIIVL